MRPPTAQGRAAAGTGPAAPMGRRPATGRATRTTRSAATGRAARSGAKSQGPTSLARHRDTSGPATTRGRIRRRQAVTSPTATSTRGRSRAPGPTTWVLTRSACLTRDRTMRSRAAMAEPTAVHAAGGRSSRTRPPTDQERLATRAPDHSPVRTASPSRARIPGPLPARIAGPLPAPIAGPSPGPIPDHSNRAIRQAPATSSRSQPTMTTRTSIWPRWIRISTIRAVFGGQQGRRLSKRERTETGRMQDFLGPSAGRTAMRNGITIRPMTTGRMTRAAVCSPAGSAVAAALTPFTASGRRPHQNRGRSAAGSAAGPRPRRDPAVVAVPAPVPLSAALRQNA